MLSNIKIYIVKSLTVSMYYNNNFHPISTVKFLDNLFTNDFYSKLLKGKLKKSLFLSRILN